MQEITLKRGQVQELWNAIQAMDGRITLETDSDGRRAFVNKPYQFDNHKPQYAFSKTAEAIRGEVNALEKATKALLRKYPSEPKDRTQEQRDEIDELLSGMAEEETTVKVHKVSIVDLKVHTNQIPPSVIRQLFPMLDGEL